jgi:hypothetical protein
MSYAFSLSNPEDNLSLGEKISQEIDAGIFEFDPITDEQLAYNRQLASLLVRLNPSFVIIETRHGKDIQVTKRNGNGIDINIYKDGASISVPFWHRDSKADEVFREIWTYLRFIQEETGYEVYDAQMDEVISLDSEDDFSQALRIYASTMDMIDKTIRSKLPPTEL